MIQLKLVLKKRKIIIKESNGKVELIVDDPTALQNTEVYVYLEGLDFTPSTSDPLTRTPTSFTAKVALGERKKSDSPIRRFKF